MNLRSLVNSSLVASLFLFTNPLNAQTCYLSESKQDLPKREEKDTSTKSYFPFYAIIPRREDLVPEYIPTIKPRDNPEPNSKPDKVGLNKSVDYARKILSS